MDYLNFIAVRIFPVLKLVKELSRPNLSFVLVLIIFGFYSTSPTGYNVYLVVEFWFHIYIISICSSLGFLVVFVSYSLVFDRDVFLGYFRHKFGELLLEPPGHEGSNCIFFDSQDCSSSPEELSSIAFTDISSTFWPVKLPSSQVCSNMERAVSVLKAL